MADSENDPFVIQVNHNRKELLEGGPNYPYNTSVDEQRRAYVLEMTGGEMSVKDMTEIVQWLMGASDPIINEALNQASVIPFKK